jgi:hypothetical protein
MDREDDHEEPQHRSADPVDPDDGPPLRRRIDQRHHSGLGAKRDEVAPIVYWAALTVSGTLPGIVVPNLPEQGSTPLRLPPISAVRTGGRNEIDDGRVNDEHGGTQHDAYDRRPAASLLRLLDLLERDDSEHNAGDREN